MVLLVPQFRFSEAARLLGVSDDTVRRWVDAGLLSAGVDTAGRKAVEAPNWPGLPKRRPSRSLTRRMSAGPPETSSSDW